MYLCFYSEVPPQGHVAELVGSAGACGVTIYDMHRTHCSILIRIAFMKSGSIDPPLLLLERKCIYCNVELHKDV